MKYILISIAIILCLTGSLLLACPGFGYFVGTGPIVTQTYDYEGFTGVEISNAFEYEINRSDQFSISISARENIIDRLDITLSGKNLIVRLKPGSYNNTDTRAVITMPELSRLIVSGASRGNVSGFESSNTLELRISGASQLNMDIAAGKTRLNASGASRVNGDLAVQDAEITLSGASRCEIVGSAASTVINASGASHFTAPDFRMQNTDVNVSGASSAVIFTEGDLNIQASGASSVTYLGDPVIKSLNVSGASSVQAQ
jgi:hypothetical protein